MSEATMKNHNKYAKLPQDLDLSFHNDLDLLPDTAADIDLSIEANTDVAALNLNVSLELGDDEENKDNEILFASGGVSGGGVGCKSSLGVAPLVTGTLVASAQQEKRKQQLEQHQLLAKRKICGLSSESVIKVSLERSESESTSNAIGMLVRFQAPATK
ncbi:hypothetical protein KR026_011715 [Drosophila bipectinata]|nr:hypothetical protein KR026_011715 [Drosophila bipectinata]